MIVYEQAAAPGARNSIVTPLMRGGYQRWEPGRAARRHSHDGAEEVFVFLEGECEITVGDETRVVRAGQAVFVPAEVPHTLRNVGSGDLVMFLVVAPNREPTHTFYDEQGTAIVSQGKK